jgi:hypothetical protein
MNYKKFLGAASKALMMVIIVTLVLAPGASAQSKYKTLYKFTGGADGNDPLASLIFDQLGNLYGTEWGGGNLAYCLDDAGCGTVFKLTSNTDGSWTESVLYTFCSLANCSDGAGPPGQSNLRPGRKSLRHHVGGGRFRCGYGFQAGAELGWQLDGERPL